MRFTIKLGAALKMASAAVLGLAVLGQPGLAAAQDLPGGTWGPALALNVTVVPPAGMHFVSASIQDVSCVSPGNCAAIGTYDSYATTATVITLNPFVMNETDGTWGTPTAVAGVTSGTPQYPVGGTVSCAAAGECAAGWMYYDANDDAHAYVIDESQGAWGEAQPVTIGSLYTALSSVTCPAAGDCTAVGTYVDSAVGTGRPFVMDSSAGTWNAPQEAPGFAGLSSPSPVNGEFTSLTCTSAGNCVAGGYYHLSSTAGNNGQPFLDIETDGSWGQAQPVAGMTALNPTDNATLRSVSCGGPVDCVAMGLYENPVNGVSTWNTWVAVESGGTWGPAQQLPAPAAASSTRGQELSCPAQSSCVVAGQYFPAAGGAQKAFVASYVSGAWAVQDVAGLVAAQSSYVSNVSCGAPGYCTVGGYYYPAGSGMSKPFLADDVNGTWASAQDVAGLPGGLAGVNDVSCTAAGYCTAAGIAGNTTFTVSEATAVTVTLQASAPTVTYGDEEAETLTATVTSPAGGTPTGTVTVTDGNIAVCSITLANGTGTCTLPATTLPGGTDQLTATYGGDASYAANISTAAITVAKATTAMAITVSPASVPYDANYQATVSVTVSPQFAGTPTGSVSLYMNGTLMCAVGLGSGGKMSCPSEAGQNAGRYTITGSYAGDGNFTASTAPTQYATIARQKTSTNLALSRTSITYGHETAEKLTVSISSTYPNWASGKVTLKSGGTTVCVITLKPSEKSSGTCTLRATQLRAGTYHIVASYPGNSNNLGSTSSSKTLKVAA